MPTANEQFQAAKVANNTSFSAEWARTQQTLAKMSAGDRAAQLGFSSLQPGEYVMAYDALGQARMRIGHQTDGTVAVVYGNGKPPPVPTAPIVSSRQLAVFVYWDGKFTGGYARPGDLGRVDVHMADDSAFIPDGTTIVGSLPQEGGLIVPADNETHYIKIVAVSTSDVASAATDGIAVLPLPAGQIAAGAIGAQQLAADIALLSRLVVGNPTAARLEVEGRVGALVPGIHLYNDSGQETCTLNANTGDVSIRGEIRTADTGKRLVLNTLADNTLRFYPNTGTNYAVLYADTFQKGGVDYGGLLISGAQYNNQTYRMWVLPDYLTIYRGDPTGALSYGGLYIQPDQTTLSYSTVPNSTGTWTTSFTATGSDVSMTFGVGNDVVVDGTGIYLSHAIAKSQLNIGTQRWAFQDNVFGSFSLNSAFFFATTGVDIYNPTSGAPLGIGASAFVTKSARETKTDIEDVPFDPLEVIHGAPSSMWNRRDGETHTQIGPMADDLPDVLQVETGPENNRAIGIDLVSQIGVLWAAIPQLTARLDALEKK